MKKIFLSLFLLLSILNGETVEQIVDRINQEYYNEAMKLAKANDMFFQRDFTLVEMLNKYRSGSIDKYQYFGFIWCLKSDDRAYVSKYDSRYYDHSTGVECSEGGYLQYANFIKANIKSKNLVINFENFDRMDPYNNVGIWTSFKGKLLQRLNKKSGLFQVGENVFYIENLPTNKSYREGQTYSGIVRGGGEYQYTTTFGGMKIVPKATKVFSIQ